MGLRRRLQSRSDERLAERTASLPVRRFTRSILLGATGVAFTLTSAGVALGQAEDESLQTEVNVDERQCQEDPAIVSCVVDESVRADGERLRQLMQDQLASRRRDRLRPSDVTIRFVGKGRTVDFTADEPILEGTSFEGTGRGEAMDAWRAFNPATQNEFELAISAAARARFDRLIPPDEPTPRVPAGPSPEGPNAEFRINDWSGGVDDRVRRTDNETYPWSTIADMGGCTATFIGPRHIVTAGHCIYTRGRAATDTQPAVPPGWMPSFSVRPQRDAGDVPFSTSMPPGPGEEGWYFTPVGWRDPAPAGGAGQYDFAVVVVPDRLGEQVSWMGYGTLTDATLQSSALLLRGYPFCESETAVPGERIDEPRVAGQPGPNFGCVVNGFYAGSGCSVAAFSSPDPQGWNRRVTHGCDAGAANSGSALYVYVGNTPMVTGVHTTSTKCRFGPDPTANPPFAGDSPCTTADTHTLVMTRITPEYRGWISYFRNLFP